MHPCTDPERLYLCGSAVCTGSKNGTREKKQPVHPVEQVFMRLRGPRAQVHGFESPGAHSGRKS